jgi:hypothetical protein
MTVSRADWDSKVPWSKLAVGLPIRPERGEIAKVVAHAKGTYGWQYGDWVSHRAFGHKFHKGIDVVGWMDPRGKEHSLKKTLCLAPFDGLVEFVGSDEDEQPSIVLRHSTRGETRFRISFFGDLSEVAVEDGARVKRGDIVGRPGRTPSGRPFTHFGIGYRPIPGTQFRKEDYFVDPFRLFPGAKSAIK